MKIGKLLYLDVTVHDAHTMTVVKGPQELIQVATDIIISQGLEQCKSKVLLNTCIILDNTWYSCLKSVLLTCSNISAGVRLTGSYGYQFLTASTFDKKLGLTLTTPWREITLVPPLRFSRIFISRLIFFFLTGFSVFTTHFSLLFMLMDSNTYTGKERMVHSSGIPL